MATFKVKNIIKIKNVTNSDLAFRPYRQNFTYVVKSGDTLELRTNNAQKSLQYYKAVLPYADVDMIDNFDTDSFSIVVSINSGTYSGDTEIAPDGTANVTLTADGGYVLPQSITVSGASYTYDSTTGVVSLSAPTGNVSINAVCTASMKAFAVGDTLVSGTSKLHVDTALASEAIYEWKGGVPRGKPVTLVKVGAVNCLVAENSIGGFTITLNGAPLFEDVGAKWTGLDANGDIVISSSGEITEVNTTLQWGNGVYFFNK